MKGDYSYRPIWPFRAASHPRGCAMHAGYACDCSLSDQPLYVREDAVPNTSLTPSPPGVPGRAAHVR